MAHINDYFLTKILGQGTYGTTYLGFKEGRADNLYAIKKIDIPHDILNRDELIKQTEDEIDVLKKISSVGHCNVHISCIYDNFTSLRGFYGDINYYIVMEYIKGMSLHEYIKSIQYFINRRDLWAILYQLSKGLYDIHRYDIAHKDIKPDNIMINEDGNIKYIDFGLACVKSCITKNCGNICDNKIKGTAPYIPPELIYPDTNFNTDNLFLSQQGDVWSLGIVIYEIINGIGRYPYSRYNLYDTEDFFDNILNSGLEFEEYYGDNFVNIILKDMIVRDPYQRITSGQLFEKISKYVLDNNIV